MLDGLQTIKKINKAASFSKTHRHLVGKKMEDAPIFGAFDGCLFE